VSEVHEEEEVEWVGIGCRRREYGGRDSVVERDGMPMRDGSKVSGRSVGCSV